MTTSTVQNGLRRTLLALLGLTCLAACAAPIAFIGVAGAAGVYATQEYRSNSTAMWLSFPAQEVYSEALLLLEDMAPIPVTQDAETRTAEASFSHDEYAFRVESRGPERCRISIGVQRFGMWDRPLADAYLARLVKRLR
jgi:hypothetical protein